MPNKSEIERIAAKLTRAQRRGVLQIGDDVVLAATINAHTGTALFKRGIITMTLAAGYRFTSLTDLGLAVRASLQDHMTGDHIAGAGKKVEARQHD